MNLFTVLSMCLAVATGNQQIPKSSLSLIDDKTMNYYETEAIPFPSDKAEDPLSDEFIEKINQMQSTWKVR